MHPYYATLINPPFQVILKKGWESVILRGKDIEPHFPDLLSRATKHASFRMVLSRAAAYWVVYLKPGSPLVAARPKTGIFTDNGHGKNRRYWVPFRKILKHIEPEVCYVRERGYRPQIELPARYDQATRQIVVYIPLRDHARLEELADNRRSRERLSDLSKKLVELYKHKGARNVIRS